MIIRHDRGHTRLRRTQTTKHPANRPPGACPTAGEFDLEAPVTKPDPIAAPPSDAKGAAFENRYRRLKIILP